MCIINYKTTFVLTVAVLRWLNLASCSEKFDRTEDIFNHDLKHSYKIEPSDQSIQKLNLKCGADSMYIQLETEKDFSGVMYTRGSFYKQTEPCFVRPEKGSSRSLEMKFSMDQCQTMQEGDVYSNIVVVQNDPELVTPGDSAFSLECDFRRPRSVQVEADMQAHEKIIYSSRITLTSPDPSALDPINPDDTTLIAHSDSDSVTYIPVKTNSKVVGTVEAVSVIEQHKIIDEL